MSDCVNITTTCPDEPTAIQIGDRLLSLSLVASVQRLGPIQSDYWWRSERHRAEEWLLQLKAPAANFARIEAEIKALHPYDLPEIYATPIIRATPEYLAWIRSGGKKAP